MEESEKRKERLKVMRMEASQTGAYADSKSPGSAYGALLNPLIENETATASPNQHNLPRFGYYTDPMAAFSGSKRRNDMSPQVFHGHHNTPPRLFYQGTIPNPEYNYHPPVTFPGPGPLNPYPPRAQFNHGPPLGPTSPLSRPQQYPPTPWAPPGGGAYNNQNFHPRPNFPRGGNFTSPSPRPTNSNHYNPGRGRGMGPDSGPSFSRRGVGPHDFISAEQRPDLYYRKEMVEDPWRFLSPVVWKSGEVCARDSGQSWLPKSISMKKSKASPGGPQGSISQQSLAEYLAETFNDSTD
ncbi:hydroxyproline-rich glycoprotein [Striga asiatica]|uniref:Hydroxyproline-rich glycoprotein n=1 Tax=Striga asiatica TaxID=4170 RepID=A0A5A7PY35_STRAF|nr:hydroxyproline-rich glycoprotein [Striga asiatica]